MTRLSSAPEEPVGGPTGEVAAPAGGAQPERDRLRQQMLDVLRRRLGDAVVGSEIAGGDMWVRVEGRAWRRLAEVCRDELHMDYFCFLSGIDWMVNPAMSGEKVWEPEGGGVVMEGDEGDAPAPTGIQTGVGGGDSRFQVFARLYSVTGKIGLTLKVDLDESDPRLDSWVSVYRGADWHERETWEMYGFDFEGHPRLRHIYLPGEFEGHPLRKDFPLLSREVKPWPGLVDVEPMPGEEAGAEDATAGAGAER
ncbi:MAG: NADH-quinone oxidoreductase subunit C [Actinomycetota bacterium]|nr:NADH-quinone oxidoreductase subunit C [Actinomycetota bacterium]